MRRMVSIWQDSFQQMRRFLRRTFSFEDKSAWLRFLLLPVLGVVIWMLFGPLGNFLSQMVDTLFAEAPLRFEQLFQVLANLLPSSLAPLGAEFIPPPAPPSYFHQLWNWLSELGRENIQLFLLIGASLWIAYRLMIHFVHYLYEMENYHQAARMVGSAFLPFNRRKALIQNGVETTNDEISVQEMVGGRLAFSIDAQHGFAAVLERPGAFTRIVGPQDSLPVSLDGFMHLRQVVDLRDQRVSLSQDCLTRDGIPIKVDSAAFICRVAGSRVSGPRMHFQACDPEMVHSLVYRHWIGQDWESPAKRRKALNDLVSITLDDFISQHSFVEFLPDLPGFKNLVEFMPHRTPLFEQFAQYFSHSGGQHGLQLVWTGRGEWQLGDVLAFERVAKSCRQAYGNWMHNQPEVFSQAGILARHQEAERLARHVTRLYDDMLKAGQSDDQIMIALARHYTQRLQSAIRILEARGEESPAGWAAVLKHLEQL